MMRHRTTYADHGLVFARELARGARRVGDPLPMTSLEREYARLATAAGVKRIKFHGLPHTCATLLRTADPPTPMHVVSERLGAREGQYDVEVYAHVLPNMQRDAATTLGAILRRRPPAASGRRGAFTRHSPKGQKGPI